MTQSSYDYTPQWLLAHTYIISDDSIRDEYGTKVRCRLYPAAGALLLYAYTTLPNITHKKIIINLVISY